MNAFKEPATAGAANKNLCLDHFRRLFVQPLPQGTKVWIIFNLLKQNVKINGCTGWSRTLWGIMDNTSVILKVRCWEYPSNFATCSWRFLYYRAKESDTWRILCSPNKTAEYNFQCFLSDDSDNDTNVCWNGQNQQKLGNINVQEQKREVFLIVWTSTVLQTLTTTILYLTMTVFHLCST